MPGGFEMRFEEEGRVHFSFHQYRTRGGKPTIKLFGPCAEQDRRRGEHRALDGQAMGPGGEVRRAKDCCHDVLPGGIKTDGCERFCRSGILTPRPCEAKKHW